MDQTDKSIVKFIGYGLLSLFLLIVLFSSFTIIDAQEKGVVTRLGRVSRILNEGPHFKMPFIESVTKMNAQKIVYNTKEMVYTKDTQTVSVETTLTYAIDPNKVDQIFREVRDDYESRYVVPALKGAIKDAISKYTAQGVIDNRIQATNDVKNLLAEKLLEKGINIDDVNLTNLDFDDAYETAVRNKQVAEQEALTQINITKQEDEKKKQEILKAEALAEKTRLEAVALASSQGQKVIEKIYAEAALKAAERWDGKLPDQMIPGSTLPFIQLGNK